MGLAPWSVHHKFGLQIVGFMLFLHQKRIADGVFSGDDASCIVSVSFQKIFLVFFKWPSFFQFLAAGLSFLKEGSH
ncbi:hypothetical protein Bealeia1_01435 [Candidatus Bealeia paramacronuclearis]|uniref:Uncharacterized protein n=1 Tax=Candidatus Bealeia paramacronuclearis TaxID=1921001 RepID=A0ABZ2C4W3_9PROT|nr:hypothetical protein [Candidatus Bealeia paramacronuclearis]